MTPLERAEKIVEYFAPRMNFGTGIRQTLRDAVHYEIVSATNDELEKRRELERTFTMKLEQGYKTVRLIVVNPLDGQEYAASMQARIATDLRDDAAAKAKTSEENK